MHSRRLTPAAAFLLAACAPSAQRAAQQDPIIDVHLHALGANLWGPPPQRICVGDVTFPGWDPQERPARERLTACSSTLSSPISDEQLLRQTLAMMERYNIIGVVSGPVRSVRQWRAAAPNRVIPALFIGGTASLDSIRRWASDSTIRVLGELTFQLVGLRPTDSIPEAYYALAEELDLPVAARYRGVERYAVPGVTSPA